MLESLLNFLRRRRAVTLAVGFLLLAVTASQVHKVSVNDAAEKWMPRSAVQGWERFATHFEYGDTVVFGLEFHNGVRDKDVEFLQAMRHDLEEAGGDKILRVTDASIPALLVEFVPLTELLQTPPPGADDPYDTYRGLLYDDPRVWRANPYATTPEEENRTLLMIAEVDATTDPSLSAEVRQQALDERRRAAIKEMYAVVDKYLSEEVLQRYDLDPEDITIHKAGAVVIQYELEQIARRLVVTLVPLALLLSLATLGLGFKSWHALLIVVGGGTWATTVLIGGVVIGGWTLNVVTVCGPILMYVIIVATTVHFAQFYAADHDADANDGDLKASVNSQKRGRRFVRWVAVPCLGAAVTTGTGFLMLAFNELGPIRELGIELFFGSILSFFGGYLVWLSLPRLKVTGGKLLSSRHMLRMGGVVTQRPAVTVLLFLPLFALLAVQWTQVKVDVDPFSFFEEESYVAEALDHFASRKFGHYTLDVILVPKQQPYDELPPEVRRQDEEFVMRLESEVRKEFRDEVRRVISASAMRKRIEELEEKSVEAMRSGDVLKMLEYQFRAGAFRETFKNWLHDKKQEGTMRVTFMAYDSGTGFRPLLDKIRSTIHRLSGDRFDYFFTGTANSVAVLSEQLVGAMTRGLLAALAAMAALCIVLFRSLRLTLVAVLPNAFPILVVFGVMGIFDVPLNSGSAMVATIALGVGLNDTVHFVMHYRRRRLAGSATEDALRETFEEIARPMILTSVVNCAGFAIFLLAEFRPMHHFGLLASIAMAAALVGDLLLLPNLLRIFDRRFKRLDDDLIEPVTAYEVS